MQFNEYLSKYNNRYFETKNCTNPIEVEISAFNRAINSGYKRGAPASWENPILCEAYKRAALYVRFLLRSEY